MIFYPCSDVPGVHVRASTLFCLLQQSYFVLRYSCRGRTSSVDTPLYVLPNIIMTPTVCVFTTIWELMTRSVTLTPAVSFANCVTPTVCVLPTIQELTWNVILTPTVCFARHTGADDLECDTDPHCVFAHYTGADDVECDSDPHCVFFPAIQELMT